MPNSKVLFYAGIGSRKTPADVLDYMYEIARRLALKGFVLRSGKATGADTAFEVGALSVKGPCELWSPNKETNRYEGTDCLPNDWHFEQASLVHPAWKYLKQDWLKQLHARNIGQILGSDGSLPSSFVLCWTPDGAQEEKDCTIKTGGTATAIRLASRNNIPVFNFQRGLERKKEFYSLIKSLFPDRKPIVLNKYKIKKDEVVSGVYCGRGSPWGNPEPMKNNTKEERDRVCDFFEKYISEKPELITRVKEELRGQNLICFCAPCRCHCDTLLRIANDN